MEKRVMIAGAILLCILIVIVICYAFFVMGTPPLPKWSLDVPQLQPECSPDETVPCTMNNFSGMRFCEHGRWSSCRVERVCAPGSKELCYENTCIIGYKICNEYGTGYSECILKNET